MVALKDEIQAAYLMGYGNTGEGTVLFIAREICIRDAMDPDSCQTLALANINKKLKVMLGRAMSEFV